MLRNRPVSIMIWINIFIKLANSDAETSLVQRMIEPTKKDRDNQQVISYCNSNTELQRKALS
jgi:hypothetical protein